MWLRLLIAAGFAAAPEASSGTETLSAWPPGIRCTTTFPSGETYERVYPQPGAWLAGAGAGLFVFAASFAFRRARAIAR